MSKEKMRCPFCPKEYQSYKDLKRHMERIHDGAMSLEDIEKFNKTITIGDITKLKIEGLK